MDPDLSDAVSAGQVEEVRRLILEEGRDVTLTCSVNQTLLHYSVQGPHLEVTRALIEGGADVDACDDCMGYTPLHWAVYSSQNGQIRVLLDAGANLEASSYQTPLLLAASKGLVTTTELLLAAGADLSAKSAEGQTPLHMAASLEYMHVDNVETARLLLQAGAHAGATDRLGWTPRYCATQRGISLASRAVSPNHFPVQTEPYVAPEELLAMVELLEAAEQDRSAAFAMGLEERLGVASWVRALDPGVVRMVLELEREVVILPPHPTFVW